MTVDVGTTEAFRDAFPTWRDLRAHVAAVARHPEYNEDRALHQILMADITTRLSTQGEWLLLGSLSLPARVPVNLPMPGDLRVEGISNIDQAYLLPRTAFDLDLYAAGVARQLDPADTGAGYGAGVREAIAAVTAPAGHPAAESGRGLHGLVAYIPGSLRQYDNGQVMGTITAQPIDPRYSIGSLRPVDDPITIEIDIKPPSKISFPGEPEPSSRPITALTLPGFHPVQPRLYPVADQLGDKLCLLAGPPISLRNAPAGPWHRYKDLVDSYFLIRTTPMAAAEVRRSLQTNWNLRRLDPPVLPHPYRVYGQAPVPAGEPEIPWRDGCAHLVKSNPQLARYPSFEAMVAKVGRFVDTVPNSPGAVWTPERGWQASKGMGAAALAFPQATRKAMRAPMAATPEDSRKTPPQQQPNPGRESPSR
ncbi:nucleotidyl transferase AbiEii/AbiGii toxin family protein [Micromonospora echinofusca]|uniref:nucleotidyl transferase AbiEii/AbiGii toxin family protein n=1 Tax=Micromonospora echinofusca TaxID=47858 RepID=UPI0033C7A479